MNSPSCAAAVDPPGAKRNFIFRERATYINLLSAVYQSTYLSADYVCLLTDLVGKRIVVVSIHMLYDERPTGTFLPSISLLLRIYVNSSSMKHLRSVCNLNYICFVGYTNAYAVVALFCLDGTPKIIFSLY